MATVTKAVENIFNCMGASNWQLHRGNGNLKADPAQLKNNTRKLLRDYSVWFLIKYIHYSYN